MKNLVVNKKYNNKKLSSFLLDIFDGLTMNTIYKALRKKDIIINNVRITENVSLKENDNITIYITDDFLYKKFDLKVVYDDENIVVINKPIGIEVVSKNNEKDLTYYVTTFFPNDDISPCHRLDRNTSGLVLFAKNTLALDILLKKFKNLEIEKVYLCTVYGIPSKKHEILEAYLFKDTKKSLVYISNTFKKGYQKIITEYTIKEKDYSKNTATLEVNLHTGRTHQIRAHLAHIGFPIIGDGKYGKNEINKKFKRSTQDLCAYKLKFNFKTDSGILNYLNGLEIKL
ncbi:MAG: RluA family pseudouridine synthase [Clostridia bacterium]|nr:RluA family pseudouridine synthase [Clostridia bacterium]